MDLLDIEADTLAGCFGRRSFTIRHALADHPLFSRGAIEALADRLPSEWVRREAGDLPFENRRYVEVGEGSPSETLRTIDHSGMRVSLREIQQDRVYAPLIRTCHDEVERYVDTAEGGICGRSGYIFVTTAAATTPMHFDPEHSFLLQIRGTKRVFVAGLCEPAVLRRELERYIDGQECDFDALQAASQEFVLTPGTGVYFPSFVAHWVETEGDDPSVSFSIPFYTRYSARADDVHRLNKRLRRLGLSPRPPGASDGIDRVKALVLRTWIKARGSTTLPLPAA